MFRLDTNVCSSYGASVEPWEIENLRRSLVMAGLSQEQAIRLLDELVVVQADLDRLRAGLRRLLGGDDP